MVKDIFRKKTSKNIFVIGIGIILISLIFTPVGITDEPSYPSYLNYTFSFKKPSFSATNILNENFTRITMPGCMAISKNVGFPVTPVKFVQLLIPPGSDVSGIEVTGFPVDIHLNDIDLVKNPLTPYQNPLPFGSDPPDIVEFNDEIYDSDELFPSQKFENQGIGISRGYTILSLALKPVEYVPKDGIIRYYPELTVNIELEQTGLINNFFRNRIDDQSWVNSLISNPEVFKHYQTRAMPSFDYPGGLCDPSDSYDYVIITTTYNGLDEWVTDSTTPYNWSSLMNKHTTNDGLSCTLVTIQDIDACSDYYNTTPLFNDTEAHIREFCRDAYQDWGTQYIFVGGDDEWIPAREMDTSYEGSLDTDIYWNHLDNSFNADGDNDWGEEGDSGFDLYSDMYIGRITCDEPQDVSNWMNKSFYYADSYDKDYLENAGFYGGNTGWACQGSDFMDYSAIKGTNDWLGPNPSSDGVYPAWAGFQYGFETWNNTNIGKEYNLSVKWADHSNPNPGWKGGSGQGVNGFKNAINNDQVTIISGIAHASSTSSLDVGMSSWESDYHNTRPFFIHDYGCHCGDMDASDDGVLHSMLFHDDTELAFGCVYNTGYGWGNYDTTNSSSAFQCKEFWDYFFDTTNNSITPLNWQLGKGHAWAIDRMAPTIDWGYTWRSIIQSCLLFADPAQRLKPSIFAEHGVIVTELDVDSVVPHGETIVVEATIANEGINPESNILVNFTVNGTILDYTIISSIGIGNTETVSFNWNPDYGTFLVQVEAATVPGENFTDNNWLNKTVSVIPAPDIWVSPSGFDFHVNAGDADSSILTIGNEAWAEASLSFNTSISSGSWCFVTPNTGTVPIDSSTDLSVTVDAASLTEGFYQTYIIVDCNDLDEPVVNIPVNLSVVFADDTGAVSVNCPIGQQLPGAYTVNATVENYGSEFNTFMVNCSIYEGGGEKIEDFEADNGGYTHNQGPGPGTIDDWEWGHPTYGPSGAHSGSNCWATNLDGDHSNGADSVLDSVEINLNMYQPNPELTFWQWYDHTTYDCGNVKISTDGGSTWSIITPDGGYTGTATSGNQGIPGEPAFTDNSHMFWHQVTFDLSAYADETVNIRWHFGSTTVTTHPGWYLDDVVVKSALVKGPGDLVYQSFETVNLPAYSSGFVEFSPSWEVTNLSFYAIRVKTELVGDEDPSNDEAMGVVEIATAPEGHIALLEPDWNFVSLPFNQSVNKVHLIVNVGGVDYSWSDAVTAGFVSDFILGWGRSTQSYNFASAMDPGYGYWIFAYQSCELKAPVFNINYDGFITNLKEDWNVVGHPNNMPCNKSDIIVAYEGIDYSWADAVTNGYLSDYIFNWNSIAQTYSFGETLEPGYAYWVYAYYECMVHS